MIQIMHIPMHPPDHTCWRPTPLFPGDSKLTRAPLQVTYKTGDKSLIFIFEWIYKFPG